jgi:hypothetical protein
MPPHSHGAVWTRRASERPQSHTAAWRAAGSGETSACGAEGRSGAPAVEMGVARSSDSVPSVCVPNARARNGLRDAIAPAALLFTTHRAAPVVGLVVDRAVSPQPMHVGCGTAQH